MNPAGSYRIAAGESAHFDAIREVEAAAEAQFDFDDLPASQRGDLSSLAELATAQREGLLWVVLDPSGAVVGCAMARWAQPDLHLEEIDVAPAHQQRGIGTSLVDTVRGHAVLHRAAHLTLTTFRNPPWNMRWYAQLGFVAVDAAAHSPALAATFEDEVERGLSRNRRVAMVLALP